MKRLMLLVLMIITIFSTGFVKSQVNVNININSQPDWGPRGYNYVESYYLPEYDIYYNVPHRRYYYFSGNRWLHSTALPVRYRHINLYQTHKVVLVDRYPFKRHKVHYKQYARYRGDHGNHLVVRNYKHKPHNIVKVNHFNSNPRYVHKKMVSKKYHNQPKHQKFGKIKGHGKPHNKDHKGHR
ncbi:hypothetical protein J2X97_000561 [Epilithonimonas hungarica]|uniref:hypothetical protein n=1 Tax=Epilithonimonas hungarica TaxID=454006 RepID=UPI0012CF2A99|nr:hypothetical protein [Epilithonimonas hungarica]MDP9954924.1 hypothetical protein [Epilithonimonas hungarica]MPT32366.1 hypothetical protein [Chryseobacterium sp.]